MVAAIEHGFQAKKQEDEYISFKDNQKPQYDAHDHINLLNLGDKNQQRSSSKKLGISPRASSASVNIPTSLRQMIKFGNGVDIDHNQAAVRFKVKGNRVKARQIDQCEYSGTHGDSLVLRSMQCERLHLKYPTTLNEILLYP